MVYCFIIRFALENKHYTISRDYSALSDEIFDILRILKALEAIILDLTPP